MPLSHRIERISEQVREELSQMLATEVGDPGIGLITITRVKVTGDLSLARVYWTAMGTPEERAKTEKALRRTLPYLRHLLATRLPLRRVPELQFHFDASVAAQDRIERILLDLKEEENARRAEASADAAAPDTTESSDKEAVPTKGESG